MTKQKKQVKSWKGCGADEVNYSHLSHTHCFDQEYPPCGIPFTQHSQCCLCDLKYGADEVKDIEGSHPTKDGYCCACEYDIVCLEEKIKATEEKKGETKRIWYQKGYEEAEEKVRGEIVTEIKLMVYKNPAWEIGEKDKIRNQALDDIIKTITDK